MPKANMYQSLHTTLISSTGQPFEIQIRTYDMHRTAEYGIAAHWKYKEGQDGKSIAQKEEEKLSWLRQILEWQKDMSDNKEFLHSLKTDLDIFSESVYCFTPEGDVKNLPSGSTTVDFAYSIHSAVGNKMVGARVNDKLVPIDYVIQNGDRVEIITSQNSKGPSRDWLKSVRSAQAKNKINQWFKTQNKEENIIRGKEMIERYCKTKGINFADIGKPEYEEKVMAKYGFQEWNAVLAAIGHGGLKEGQVINKLLEVYKKKNPAAVLTDEKVLEDAASKAKKPAAKGKGGIVVKGVHDLAVRFSRCCSPVPAMRSWALSPGDGAFPSTGQTASTSSTFPRRSVTGSSTPNGRRRRIRAARRNTPRRSRFTPITESAWRWIFPGSLRSVRSTLPR